MKSRTDKLSVLTGALIEKSGLPILSTREDLEIYSHCVKLIIEKLEERMLRLNSCCKSSLDDFDFSSIGFSSHQLKGSFLIAGARNLGFLCDEISEAAREKDVDKLRNQISILNRLVPQFKAELNSLLQDFKLRMEEKSSFF